MMFDEPTSALDPEMIEEVLNVIKDLVKENRTMILIIYESDLLGKPQIE